MQHERRRTTTTRSLLLAGAALAAITVAGLQLSRGGGESISPVPKQAAEALLAPATGGISFSVKDCRIARITDWPDLAPFNAFMATVTAANRGGEETRITRYSIAVGPDGSLGAFEGSTARLKAGERSTLPILLPDPNILGPDPELQRQPPGPVACSIAAVD